MISRCGCPVVLLDDCTLRMAYQVGMDRYFDSRKKKLNKDKHGKRDSIEKGIWDDLMGAAGECAFAKYKDIFWDGSVSNIYGRDVGEWNVRTTDRNDYSLIIRDDRKNGPYALVIARPPYFRIAGYRREDDERRDEWLRNPNDGRESYFVPQRQLRRFLDKSKGGRDEVRTVQPQQDSEGSLPVCVQEEIHRQGEGETSRESDIR